jgi:WD40 repeat protein/serine/threonine protein kinase
MPVDTVLNLVDTLRQFRLLESDQYEEVVRSLAGQFPDPKNLARELLKRGWLTPFQVNQVFQGKAKELVLGVYLLLDRLGEGGMGMVFRARQISMGRVVALKVIRKDRVRNEQTAKRFLREILAASKLQHPNVVRAFDADQVGDTVFFAMEYVEGEDLGKLVKTKGPLGIQESCDFIRQAALGLQNALEHGLIHRDIKPANLLVTNKDRVVKILDMGLARLDSGDSNEDSGSALTQDNVVMGTPDYLAPEQARDAHNVDIRADLYSLGCTLYFLLVGRVPFPGGQLGEKLIKHQLEHPTPLRQLRADVPGEVEEVVQRLMAKKPEDRYQTPAELAQDLSCLLSGERPLPRTPIPAAAAPAKSPDNPFLDLGGTDTLPSAETSPSRKILKPAKPSKPAKPDGPSLPSKIKSVLSKTGTALQPAWQTTVQTLHPVADKIGLPRDKTHFLLLGGLGAFLLLFVGCLLIGRQGGDPPGPDKGLKGPQKKAVVEKSPLDVLAPSFIAAEDRLDWFPKETVALLGETKGRHPDGMNRLVLSPDGKTLATVGPDFTIRLWNADTLRQQAVLKGHDKIINSLVFSPDSKLLVSGSSDKTIRFWNLLDAPPREEHVLKDMDGLVYCLAFSEDGKTLVSGGADQKVIFWDLEKGAPVKKNELTDFQEEVRAVAFSMDGKMLAAGDKSSVRLWDLSFSGPMEKTRIELTSPKVYCLRFTRDGQTLFAGASGTLHALNLGPAGEEISKIKAAVPGLVTEVALGKDDKTIAVAGDNLETVFKWKGGPKLSTKKIDVPDGRTVGVSWLGDSNKYLVTGHASGTIRLWEARKSLVEPYNPPVGHLGEVAALAISPDSKFLATGSGAIDKRVLLWSLATAKPTLEQEIDAGTFITTLAFSPDGKYLAGAGTKSPIIQLWDMRAKDFLKPAVLQGYSSKAHGVGIHSLAFSPDSQTLVSGGQPEICVWDLRFGLPKGPMDTLTKHTSTILAALAFRPDGLGFASAGNDNQICLWQMGAKPPLELQSSIAKAHSGGVTCLAFDPDGKTLVSGGKDKAVRCWDLKENQELKGRFSGHKHPLTAVAFNAKGTLLLTADQGGLLIVWDMAANQSTTWQFDTPITRAVFAPDGRHLAAATATGAVFILRLGSSYY